MFPHLFGMQETEDLDASALQRHLQTECKSFIVAALQSVQVVAWEPQRSGTVEAYVRLVLVCRGVVYCSVSMFHLFRTTTKWTHSANYTLTVLFSFF